MGLWGPLAMASLYQAFFGVFRKLGEDVKIPETSEILRSWALPFLAEALEKAEGEREAERVFEFVENLKRKQDQKK